MKLIITDNCSLIEKISLFGDIPEQFFHNISKITPSLTKIIITDVDAINYKTSIITYSQSLEKNINISEASAGKTISGLNHVNELEQYIFIRGDCYYYFCYYLSYNTEDLKQCIPEQDYIDILNSAIVVFHEIGHSILSDKLYKNYEYICPDKQFMLPAELAEYAKLEMISFWSEYYAERYAISMIKEYTLDAHLVKDLIKAIKNNKSINSFNQTENIRDLLYNFSLVVAYYDSKNIYYDIDSICETENMKELLLKVRNQFMCLYTKSDNFCFQVECDKLKSIYIEIYCNNG